ncbi:MAG: adenylate/guanylate cyclase domain-containing protein [Treponema sp.]|nr:adenylate/guanylate cyclase domain-containing protein [Treponema sp.]
MKFWKNILLGFAAAAFFSFLYIAGILNPIEDKLYDFFLRFRAKRERIDSVVFLDVDDTAIAYNGVFPWPRSVTADGLLRLKEFGAKAAIFDIEYIDKGPQGVDTIYLDQGLPEDFNRSFSEIRSAASDIITAFSAGRLSRSDIAEYSQELTSLINDEQNRLFTRAQGVARDNDLYLAEASALFGRSWASLNLRPDPLSGEQATRRPMAEELFSYPVNASPSALTGKNVDILPALPSFSQSARGAGYTNVEIDSDGIRRRIFLAQKIFDRWYLQLAFSPLIGSFGNPAIELNGNKLLIRDAYFPSGRKDISIPLDGQGRMMLDWPPENYMQSYRHISFAEFSLLEDREAELEKYSKTYLQTDLHFFGERDSSLTVIPVMAQELAELFDAIHDYRAAALEYCSDEYFTAYIDYRADSRTLIQEIIDLDPGTKAIRVAAQLAAEGAPSAEAAMEEAEYINGLTNAVALILNSYNELRIEIENTVRDRFCILGRVDTGTTDIGVNPFHGEYVNVGTHAVVLDTILSESFIVPLGIWWCILVTIVAVPLFILLTASLSPVLRASLGFSGALIFFIASILLFRFTGIFFGPLGLVLAMISAVVIREIISYAGSEQEKRFYRKAFATYTSEAVADEIAKNPSLLQLGGTKRRMSAIFTDVKGFSTISEKLTPEDLVSLLNRYLTVMSNVVLDEEGTIDKYEGDAIIAFFGAPLEQKDHALRACLSAVKIKKAEEELNKVIMEQNLSPSPLLTRVGINSGDMVAGNMGTDKKMNYTIMGDAVNLAARLEGVNKQYGTWILASQDTIWETGDSLLTRRLDRVRVVGKSEPVQLYNILDTLEDASADQKKLVEVFHQALDCFEKREWNKAEEGFNEVLSIEANGPAVLYQHRCKKYLSTAPEDGWDGVFNLTEK